MLAHGPEPARALEAIAAILEPQIDPEGTLQLVERMPVGDREGQLGLLTAFHAGLVGSGLPSNQ